MAAQNYSNHRRHVTMFNCVLFALFAQIFIGSLVNLYKSLGDQGSPAYVQRLTDPGAGACALMLFVFCRSFALKAQDRAIRAEENLRHFVLTGKLLDPRLTVRQIVGLRFASDAEFVQLAVRAAEKNLTENRIKLEIKVWRADTYRV